MEKKGSSKSSKNGRARKQPAAPAEHQPVKSVGEVPIALVEIVALINKFVGKLEDVDCDQIDIPVLIFDTQNLLNIVKTLAESCTHAIKVEGLTGLMSNFDLSLDEKRLIEQSLNHYFNYSGLKLTSEERYRIEAMIALFEGLQVSPPSPEDSPEPAPESGLAVDYPEQTCRVCGCTESDCSQCIEKTGEPCFWIEADLCSACDQTEIDLVKQMKEGQP